MNIDYNLYLPKSERFIWQDYLCNTCRALEDVLAWENSVIEYLDMGISQNWSTINNWQLIIPFILKGYVLVLSLPLRILTNHFEQSRIFLISTKFNFILLTNQLRI